MNDEILDPSKEMLLTLMQDILPHIHGDEMLASGVGSLKILQRGAAAMPHVAWDEIRRRLPHAATFPLGTVAERATRRLVYNGVGRGTPAAVHQYVSLFLFELALLNLRGSSDTLRHDFGWWYHWHPDGHYRSLDEETLLRALLWRASTSAAAELLRAWRRHRPDGCATFDDVDRALRDVFERGLAQPRHVGSKINVVSVPKEAEAKYAKSISDRAVRIVLSGKNTTAHLHDRQLVEACGGEIDSRLRDLVDIATTFYFADICLPRNPLFARDLVLLVPVRHRGLWSASAERVARIASFLTGSDVAFRFVDHEETRGKAKRLKAVDDERFVTLFSGGLDSFAGVARAVAERRKPILLSHVASSSVSGVQRALIDALRAEGELESVSVRTSSEKELPVTEELHAAETELYQHGRSFLFLALATTLALSKGIANVRVYENGPVSLNATFSEARFNTRTTHPVFFAEFRELVREVLGVELRIGTPFELMTKGEAVKSIPQRMHSLIAKTSSCWAYARVGLIAQGAKASGFSGHHCGRCVPCIWRRAAIAHAGLEAFDDAYVWDSVRDWDKYLDRRHHTVLLDLYRASCNALATSSEDELLALFPDLDEIGPGTLPERLAMHRRYANEIVGWFDENAARLFNAAPLGDGSGRRSRTRPSPSKVTPALAP